MNFRQFFMMLVTGLMLVVIFAVSGCNSGDSASSVDGPGSPTAGITLPPAPYRILSETMQSRTESVDGEAQFRGSSMIQFDNGSMENVQLARPQESLRAGVRSGAITTYGRNGAMHVSTISDREDTLQVRGPEGSVSLRLGPDGETLFLNGRVVPGANLQERMTNARNALMSSSVVQAMSNGEVARVDHELARAPEVDARGRVWKGIKKVGGWVWRNVLRPRLVPTM